MRVLIIRFSSFGDIFQALEAAKHLSESDEVESVNWLVRRDFAPLLENQKSIQSVLPFDRESGLKSVSSLIKMAWRVAPQYDRVYDAHSNLRSFVVRNVIRIRWLIERIKTPMGPSRRILIRSKERIRRFLFFKMRLPTLPFPYRGSESYLWPLREWLQKLEIDFSKIAWNPPLELASQSAVIRNFKTWRLSKSTAPLIALAPSAAWPNKRWPVERWLVLVREWLNESPDSVFLLLGGPDDQFLNEIENELGSSRVFNSVAQTTLLESAALLSQADALVANDTGLLHVADRLQIPSVAIIGPTAFGYPSSPVARIAEVSRSSLPCKPCSKDGRDACTNSVKLKCLLDVSPSQVIRELKAAFESKSESRDIE